MALRRLSFWVSLFAVALLGVSSSSAATPTVAQALQLTPTQDAVEYDTPTEKELENCTIKAEKDDKSSGWVVRDGGGQILRRFRDTNADNFVDQWCYYHNGIEVYRDIDSDYNGKAEAFRWLNTAGTRWGLDTNADGKLDDWKIISAEEVTLEVVQALAKREVRRFEQLLLTNEELDSLGLGKERKEDLAKKISGAGENFASLSRQQKTLNSKSQWLNFGAVRPGVVPAGTEGSTKDVTVYENALALVGVEGKTTQLLVGTLVKVGDRWRLIEAPKLMGQDEHLATDGGHFFRAALSVRPETEGNPAAQPDNRVQDLLAELEKVDKQIQAAGDSAPVRLHAQRADILEKIIAATEEPKDRRQWTQQLADMVSATAQSGQYPAGVDRLQKLLKTVQQQDDQELAAYVEFRYLTASYGMSLQKPDADFVKIQESWINSLKKYVKDYPDSPDTAEALLQVAIAAEFAGREDDARSHYRRIVADFPESASAKKAQGAMTRLDAVGKQLNLSGTSVTGSTVDLEKLRGRVVLLHYWATWCEPCVEDLVKIKELQAKYGRAGFTPVGVSLDARKSDLEAFLKKNRLPWAQIYEPGSLDGRLANQLGVLTLPTMLLMDKDGRVVNRNVHITELEAEIKKHVE